MCKFTLKETDNEDILKLLMIRAAVYIIKIENGFLLVKYSNVQIILIVGIQAFPGSVTKNLDRQLDYVTVAQSTK